MDNYNWAERAKRVQRPFIVTKLNKCRRLNGKRGQWWKDIAGFDDARNRINAIFISTLENGRIIAAELIQDGIGLVTKNMNS